MTIVILPESPWSESTNYLAIAGRVQSVGKTAGQALDAVTAQLDEGERGTLVVVQNLHPDAFFTAEQRQRLEDLMTRWRAARDAQLPFPNEEQKELEALVQAEVKAAAARAAALASGLRS